MLCAAAAADEPVPPPYLVTGTNHVIVGLVGDEATIRKALPSWIAPVDGQDFVTVEIRSVPGS